MEYNEFINLKLPIKTIALLGGNTRVFDDWCSSFLRHWGDGLSYYLRLSGYEYVWCSCKDDVIGTIFDGYLILPETKMSKDVYEMIQIVEDDGIPNKEQPILPMMF